MCSEGFVGRWRCAFCTVCLSLDVLLLRYDVENSDSQDWYIPVGSKSRAETLSPGMKLRRDTSPTSLYFMRRSASTTLTSATSTI